MKTFLRLCTFILALTVLSSCSSKKSDVTVANTTQQSAGISVLVCGQTFIIETLPGKHVKLPFNADSDSQYEIEVELDSGVNIKKTLGQVTAGTIWHDRIEISDNDVTLTQSSE